MEKDDRIFELRKKILAIDWDIERNQASDGKMAYRENLQKELDELMGAVREEASSEEKEKVLDSKE